MEERSKLLRQIRKIDIHNQEFSNLPNQLKKKIFQYTREDYNSILRDIKLDTLQKQKWLKTAYEYLSQKHPPIKEMHKDRNEWFLQTIAYMLFLDMEITFEIISNDNYGMRAEVQITPKNDKIILSIRRGLFTNPQDRIQMDDIFDFKTCEFEFQKKQKYGAPYSLFNLLFILMQKYRFPLEYRGDNNSVELMIRSLQSSYYQVFYHHNDEHSKLKQFIMGFLKYPIYVKNVKKYNLNKNPRHFLNCVGRTLKMKMFKKMNSGGPIDAEDFFSRYLESE